MHCGMCVRSFLDPVFPWLAPEFAMVRIYITVDYDRFIIREKLVPSAEKIIIIA